MLDGACGKAWARLNGAVDVVAWIRAGRPAFLEDFFEVDMEDLRSGWKKVNKEVVERRQGVRMCLEIGEAGEVGMTEGVVVVEDGHE